jgi:hypothetical protein
MKTVRRSKKWNVINVIYIQNDARSLPKRVNKWLYFKYLLTRQQLVIHLFFALTVSIRSWVLFPTLCGSINTKSMVITVLACVDINLRCCLQTNARSPRLAVSPRVLVWRFNRNCVSRECDVQGIRWTVCRQYQEIFERIHGRYQTKEVFYRRTTFRRYT